MADLLQDYEKSPVGSDASFGEDEKRHIVGVKVRVWEAFSLIYSVAHSLTHVDGISQWFVFVISTLTAIFVYSLDNTIVANIAPVHPNSSSARLNITHVY